MYFHATWNESYHLDTTKRIDYNYITIKGKGIYVDNEIFPSHFGTGSEDYYSYAWCRPQCFSFPNVSQPSG